MQRQCGFSLIELLIVVAIILVIAATAIPNLLRARIAANEASAGASMRTISTAELTYKIAYPNLGYANLASLGGPVNCVPSSVTSCILDSLLSSGNKGGYMFAATPSNPVFGAMTEYIITGVPQSPQISGVKGFCEIEDHVIMWITPAGPPATRAACYGGTYSPIPQ